MAIGPATTRFSSFCDQRLVAAGRDRLERKATPATFGFAAGFFAFAAVVAVTDFNTPMSTAAHLGMAAVALLPALIGAATLASSYVPAVFEKHSRRLRIGRRTARLGDVQLVQLVTKSMTKRHLRSIRHASDEERAGHLARNRRVGYEVNVVLEGGERLNVLSHGGAAEARQDARRLADFLGVPLGDDDHPFG